MVGQNSDKLSILLSHLSHQLILIAVRLVQLGIFNTHVKKFQTVTFLNSCWSKICNKTFIFVKHIFHISFSWPKVNFAAWYWNHQFKIGCPFQTFFVLLPKLKFQTVTFFSSKAKRSTFKQPSHLSSQLEACPIELNSPKIYFKFIIFSVIIRWVQVLTILTWIKLNK